VHVADLPSPALVVDADVFERNVAAMAAAHPGERLRPHVKAFKSTALARELVAAGHRTFCCATVAEVEGMVRAGVGDDVMLANEVVGRSAQRLGALARAHGDRVGISTAVDSPQTLAAATAAGVRRVVIDVNVGLARCGCHPQVAPVLAAGARAQGLEVLGVMGYEGHLMRAPAGSKPALVEAAMTGLLAAHAGVGGDLVTGGGTGTYDCNPWVTEVQAGSYCLMDTEYVAHAPAFGMALSVLGTCLSTDGRTAVVDVGLKALGMDHGAPTVEDGRCVLVSDEHTTFARAEGVDRLPRVGARVRVWPGHVDPTVAYHPRMHVVRDEQVVDVWPVDLRHW
jgi:D-serine deaminase-like pyridoxal phosphate-dependent protein